MDQFLAMSVFRSVVETGSFTKASRAMGMSTATVSRHVAHLEQRLGAVLLKRSTRHLSLTDIGLDYYQKCTEILNLFEEAEQQIIGASGVRGVIRISLPHDFGTAYMLAAIMALRTANPDLVIDLLFTDETINLVKEGVDLAIRITAHPHPNLIARKLTHTNIICCAAPSYIAKHGKPGQPPDLRKHNCLTYAYAGFGETWSFIKNGVPEGCHVTGDMRGNSGEMLRHAACAGVGIVLLPEFLVHRDIAAGRLLPLLEDYAHPPFGIYAVYETGMRRNKKIMSVLNYLSQAFAETPAPWAPADNFHDSQ